MYPTDDIFFQIHTSLENIAKKDKRNLDVDGRLLAKTRDHILAMTSATAMNLGHIPPHKRLDNRMFE